jgi:hypothetical protein
VGPLLFTIMHRNAWDGFFARTEVMLYTHAPAEFGGSELGGSVGSVLPVAESHTTSTRWILE